MIEKSSLLNRLVTALSYAADELTRLEDYAAHWADEEDSFLRRQDKVAAEAALLAYLASRITDQELSGPLTLLVDRVEKHIVTGRNAALLRRFPQTVTTLGVGFVMLNQLGRGQPDIEHVIRRAIDRGFATLTERSTFRLMDMRWTFGLFDSKLVRPIEELIPLSTLAASPHPIYTMSEDNYALTHALYYLGDFGDAAPPEEVQRQLDQVLDPFLAWNSVEMDLDLLGEFLAGALVLRQPFSPAFQFGWHMFFEAWDREGGLVGPEYSAERFAELDGLEADAYAFSENYHTIFVGGILCAVALNAPQPGGEWHRREPTVDSELVERCFAVRQLAADRIGGEEPEYKPPNPVSSELPEWVVARLMQSLQTELASIPLWLRTATECTLNRQELTSVLYDALLVVTARNYKLVQMAEALAVGAVHGPLRSLTFTRALEFLLDQQLDDGYVGIQRLLVEDKTTVLAEEAQGVIASLLSHIGTVLRSSSTRC